MAEDAELLVRMRGQQARTTAMLGMELVELSSAEGRARFRLFARPEFCNPMGTLQGGIVATALDDAAAVACIVKAGRRVGVPSIEFKLSFLSPARMGAELFAEGRVVKMGRTVTFAEADLLDASGRLLARMSTSVMLIEVEGQGNFAEAQA